MPRDASLGFVVGVALVILIAVLFYHGDGKSGVAGNFSSPPSATKRSPVRSSRSDPKTSPLPGVPRGPRSHVVQEGESLTSLAVHYYGDEKRMDVLFRANRSQLLGPDRVTAGMVLVVPELAEDE
jgi:nucleoid-associated protein YgaU